eukprot:863281-Prymnesium_polylepis.1
MVAGEDSVTEGFSKSTQGAIEALRVPFENFASTIEGPGGVTVSPLQLICLLYTSDAADDM